MTRPTGRHIVGHMSDQVWFLVNTVYGDAIAAGPFDSASEANDFDPYDDRLEVRSMAREEWVRR